MKFAVISKPRVFKDWNQEGSIEVLVSGAQLSLKVTTEFSCGELFFGKKEAAELAEGCKAIGRKAFRKTARVGSEGGCFVMAQENTDGEPYREGVRITMGLEEDWSNQVSIDLDSDTAIELASVILGHCTKIAEDEPEGLSESDKAKCWDWFARQDWNLQAVAAWAALDDFEYTEDLEAYILKQKP